MTYNITPLFSAVALHVVTTIHLGNALAACRTDAGGFVGKQLGSGLFFLQTLDLCIVQVKFPAYLTFMPGTLVLDTGGKAAVVADHFRIFALVRLTATAMCVHTGNPMAGFLRLLFEVFVALEDLVAGVYFHILTGQLLRADRAGKKMKGSSINHNCDGGVQTLQTSFIRVIT